MAVGLNRWWTSSIDVTAATVITTFHQYNNTIIAANSTTLYPASNKSSISYGFVLANDAFENTWLSSYSFFSTILPDFLSGDGEYAGFLIETGTVRTFANTDLTMWVQSCTCSCTKASEADCIRAFTDVVKNITNPLRRVVRLRHHDGDATGQHVHHEAVRFLRL